MSDGLVRRLCIKLAQATYSSALALFEGLTYGELLDWAEDVQEVQEGKKLPREEAINIEAEIL